MNWRAVVYASVVIVFLVAILSWDGYTQREVSSSVQRSLNQPIRLALEGEDAYREFLIGLRVHHYRAKFQSHAKYIDFYYDTVASDLFKHGYSFRFRTHFESDDQLRYSVRLEQEPRFVAAGSEKIDIVSRLPTTLGDQIANGDWHLAVVDGQGLAAPDQLLQILATLDIEPDSLQPRLVGELERERFDITDKGQNWFELDHERWTFRPIGDWSSLTNMQVEDLVLDTRLSRENPELLRRVGTMYQFVNMIEGAQVAQRAPLERATDAFAVNAP